MTTPDTLPYAGEDRRAMLARLAEDDFLPPRLPAISPAPDVPSPTEAALHSDATSQELLTRPTWQRLLREASEERTRRRRRDFYECWIKPASMFLYVLPVILVMCGPAILQLVRMRPRPAAPNPPKALLPKFKSERELIDTFKASHRQLKSHLSPGEAPDRAEPMPSEATLRIYGISPEGLKEIRDDWYAPLPVDDERR